MSRLKYIAKAVWLRCAWCDFEFRLSRSKYQQRLERGNKRFYCSSEHMGFDRRLYGRPRKRGK